MSLLAQRCDRAISLEMERQQHEAPLGYEPGDRAAGEALEAVMENTWLNPVKIAGVGAGIGALLQGDLDGAVNAALDIAAGDLLALADVAEVVVEAGDAVSYGAMRA
jgi:hypothetical protein